MGMAQANGHDRKILHVSCDQLPHFQTSAQTPALCCALARAGLPAVCYARPAQEQKPRADPCSMISTTPHRSKSHAAAQRPLKSKAAGSRDSSSRAAASTARLLRISNALAGLTRVGPRSPTPSVATQALLTPDLHPMLRPTPAKAALASIGEGARAKGRREARTAVLSEGHAIAG